MPLGLFSPTQTETWLKCPQLWDYKRRWEPRSWGDSPHRAIGIAVAAGLAAHYQDLIDPETVVVDTLTLLWQETPEWPWTTLKKMVVKGFNLGLALDVCRLDQVVAVETLIGHSRPDLVHREADGLVITDWKVRVSLDAKYKDDVLSKYNHSWQLLQYTLDVAQTYKEPIARAQIGLIVLSPKGLSLLHPVDVSLPLLVQWYDSACHVWGHMKNMEKGGLPWRNYTACSVPYQCDFYDACHVYHGDPDRMVALYQRKGVK